MRFLTHRLTPVSSNARHSHQMLQMAERQRDTEREGGGDREGDRERVKREKNLTDGKEKEGCYGEKK